MKQKKELVCRFINLCFEDISKNYASHYKMLHQLTSNQLNTVIYLTKFGPMSMSEYAGKMGMSRQQATQMIDLMETKELVVRQQNPTNRRSINVAVTAMGKDVVEATEKVFVDKVVKELGKLDFAQQEEVLKALQVVTKTFKQMNLDFGQ